MRTKAPPDTIAAEIIRRFGGARVIASELKIPIGRVYRWSYPRGARGGGGGGLVPAQYQDPLLEAAERLNVPLSPWDFVRWRPRAERPDDPAEGVP